MKYSLAYLDDVVIYSQSFDDHLKYLNDILTRLAEANVRLNFNKFKLTKRIMHFLGRQIEHGDIESNPKQIQALLGSNELTTTKETFRFV